MLQIPQKMGGMKTQSKSLRGDGHPMKIKIHKHTGVNWWDVHLKPQEEKSLHFYLGGSPPICKMIIPIKSKCKSGRQWANIYMNVVASDLGDYIGACFRGFAIFPTMSRSAPFCYYHELHHRIAPNLWTLWLGRNVKKAGVGGKKRAE